MDRFLRLVVCACGAAVIVGALWWWMATNIMPEGGYEQETPRKPSNVDLVNPSSRP